MYRNEYDISRDLVPEIDEFTHEEGGGLVYNTEDPLEQQRLMIDFYRTIDHLTLDYLEANPNTIGLPTKASMEYFKDTNMLGLLKL